MTSMTQRGEKVTLTPGDRVMSIAPDSTGGRYGTVRSVTALPARLKGDGTVIVPERTIVVVDIDDCAPGSAYIADGDQELPLRRLVPPIESPPWCAERDNGHDECMHAQDQVHVSEESFIRPARRAFGGWKELLTFSVSARQDPGKATDVVLHELVSDTEQVLTAHEAWALASALLTAACYAKDTATDLLPVVNVGSDLVMVEAFTQADGSPAVDVDVSQLFDDPQQLEELAANLTRWAARLRSALKQTKGAA